MSELAQVLRPLIPVEDPRALVDAGSGDDAAVYLLDDDRALVATTDFFTPIVDDPRDFGRIAAANALSDLYAMGARPLFALNLVAFPRKHLGTGMLEEILKGGVEKAREAGIAILGGHSIDDEEPKYGLVAVGEAHPRRLFRNDSARPGDRLVLTKALGTGIIATALKAGAADPRSVATAVESMATLNRAPAEAMGEVGVGTATDITGYGLLGHLHRMALESGCGAAVEASKVPLLPGARELAKADHIPGGTRRNRSDVEGKLTWEREEDETLLILLADAQTSGGLLMAVPPESLAALLDRLREGPGGSGSLPAEIGEMVEGPPGHLFLR